MVNPRHRVRLAVLTLTLLTVSAFAPAAHGQSFTLTPSAFTPFAVDPGNSATARIDLAATGGFDSSVSLTCAVTTTNPSATNIPTCLISPDIATPFATLSLTVSTCGGAVAPCTGQTSPGLYTITVTGVSGSINVTATLTLSVEDIVEDYSLSVQPTLATPSPVTAGQVATTTVTITPVGSYSGNVTLACLSIQPIVAAAPYCTFQYPPNQPLPNSVAVGNGVPVTATLLITTYGPQPVQSSLLRTRALVYALWLAVPGLLVAGAGSAKGRKRGLIGLLLLSAVACGILFLPACGQNNTNNPTGQNTPKGTYTFTLTGTDTNGVPPSNLISSPATVMVTVSN